MGWMDNNQSRNMSRRRFTRTWMFSLSWKRHKNSWQSWSHMGWLGNCYRSNMWRSRFQKTYLYSLSNWRIWNSCCFEPQFQNRRWRQHRIHMDSCTKLWKSWCRYKTLWTLWQRYRRDRRWSKSFRSRCWSSRWWNNTNRWYSCCPSLSLQTL